MKKRFCSIKPGLYEVHKGIFNQSATKNVKMVIGNRNHRNATYELVRKRPRPSLLNNKPRNLQLRMVPQSLSTRNIDDILDLNLVIICVSCHYIQNPHILAKAVEVMNLLCAPSEHTLLRQATEYLFNHRLAQGSLVHALNKLYAGNE
ncbi:unnamed protein product [Rotaria sordida]|uniref:Ubiquitin conjugation factor E4 core domain-containing protein n=3 Tax=Rotaria sordida TaxID=392033 RepID=A0A819T305_9BILA|nr:unnamed protein product [Rotaria sordida]